MGRRPVLGDHQQVVLVGRCRDAGHRAHLAVAQLAPRERLTDLGQVGQRTGHPHTLPRSAQLDPALPVQPVRGRLDPRPKVPIAPIELTKQHQEAILGRVEMRRELRQRVLELLDARRVDASALGRLPDGIGWGAARAHVRVCGNHAACILIACLAFKCADLRNSTFRAGQRLSQSQSGMIPVPRVVADA